jgi:DNA polymerase III alpha subunit (gram-positive type)
MKVVFYDLETSGLDKDVNQIIQIAAIAMEIEGNKWEPIDETEFKMKFDMDKATSEALEMNSYDKDVWEKQGLDQSHGVNKFNKFCRTYADVKRVSKKGRTWYSTRTAGHNIINFDAPFFRKAAADHGTFCPMDYSEAMDTRQLAMWELCGWRDRKAPEDFKLTTLAEYFGISSEGAHDALADVRINIEVAKQLLHPTAVSA